MSRGLAAGKSGDHSVSSAADHVVAESDTQTRLDRPAAPTHLAGVVLYRGRQR